MPSEQRELLEASQPISCPACGLQGMLHLENGNWECGHCGKTLVKRQPSQDENALYYGRRYNDKKVEMRIMDDNNTEPFWQQRSIQLAILGIIVITLLKLIF